MINSSKTITIAFFFISIRFQIHIIWLTGKYIFKISQGTKISTTKIDRSKIKPVLNLIRLRYITGVSQYMDCVWNFIFNYLLMMKP